MKWHVQSSISSLPDRSLKPPKMLATTKNTSEMQKLKLDKPSSAIKKNMELEGDSPNLAGDTWGDTWKSAKSLDAKLRYPSWRWTYSRFSP